MLIGSVGGCSGSKVASQIAAMNDCNIKRVCNLYTAYQVSHSWMGPKDEATWKSFISKQMDGKQLEMMGVDPTKLDADFISERDNSPFKVRYGMGGGPGAKVAVVFEEKGVSGKRQVAYTNGVVEEVADEQYTDLWGSGGASNTRASAGSKGSGQAPMGKTGGPEIRNSSNRPNGRPAGAPTGPGQGGGS